MDKVKKEKKQVVTIDDKIEHLNGQIENTKATLYRLEGALIALKEIKDEQNLDG